MVSKKGCTPTLAADEPRYFFCEIERGKGLDCELGVMPFYLNAGVILSGIDRCRYNTLFD